MAKQKKSSRTSKPSKTTKPTKTTAPNIETAPVAPAPEGAVVDAAPADGITSESIEQAAAQLNNRALVLILAKGKFWNHKQATKTVVKTEADARMYTLMKRLLDSPQLRAVDGVDRAVKQLLDARALPSPFRFGVFLVPIPAVERVERDLRGYMKTRDELVENFVKVYPEQAKAAADSLKELYDPRNYPTPEEIRRMFKFSWQWVTIGVPDQLQVISADVFLEERAKQVRQLQDTVTEIRSSLVAGFNDLVEKMVERLTPDADGKPKMILKSFGDNLREFCEAFDMLNITNYGELQQLVVKARSICNGMDVQTLRDSPNVRTKTLESFAAIDKQLDSMFITRPMGQRDIDLD